MGCNDHAHHSEYFFSVLFWGMWGEAQKFIVCISQVLQGLIKSIKTEFISWINQTVHGHDCDEDVQVCLELILLFQTFMGSF
jgi:hypothetical protein